MAVLIEELLLLWAGPASAVSWAPEWKPFEIWCGPDNIFMVSSSITDIVQRTQDIAHVVGKRDLRFNQSSLEILPSKAAETEATRVWLNEKMEFSWVRVLVVLGCYLDGSGSTATQIKGRLEQGRKCLGNCVLCCVARGFLRKNASNVLHHGCFKRLVGLGLLDSVDKSSTAHIISRKRWLRCMLRGRKSQDVLWVDWFRTTKRSAHALRCRLNHPSLWHRALAAVYGWWHGKTLSSWTCCNFVAWSEMVGNHEKLPGLVLVIRPGDIAGKTGSAVLSMDCLGSLV